MGKRSPITAATQVQYPTLHVRWSCGQQARQASTFLQVRSNHCAVPPFVVCVGNRNIAASYKIDGHQVGQVETGLVYTNYFISIVQQAMFAYVNRARIRSWNQPVLSNEGEVSCSRKRGLLLGLELKTDRHPDYESDCATPPHTGFFQVLWFPPTRRLNEHNHRCQQA